MSDAAPPRVALVVQRYGDEVVGGAESLARRLAERMVSDLGWSVTVFSTCARDYQTWRNEYPPGRTELRGVEVLRFPTLFPRIRPLFSVFSRLVRLASWGPWRRVGALLESPWLALQGPYCPSLLSALQARQHQFQACFFVTYLYWPTVRGLQGLTIPRFLIPTAHDEFALYFQQTRRALQAADLLLANTEPERRLLGRLLGRPVEDFPLVGVGFDDFDLPPARAASGGHLLYLGRLAKGKRVPMLLSAFLRWAEAHPQSRLELVLAGQRDPGVNLPAHPRIRYLGYVSEEERRALTAGALAVVNPSPQESLSMIVIEALAHLKPALVNRECPVLADYARQVDTVFAFAGEEEFGAVLDRLLATDWAAAEGRQRLERAREWGRSRYSWSAVLGRLERAVAGRVGAHLRPSAAPVPEGPGPARME